MDVSYFYDPVTGRLDTLNYERCSSDPGVENSACTVERTFEYNYEPDNAKRLESVFTVTDEGAEGIVYAYNGTLPLSETMTGTVNGKITYSHNGFFELTGMKVNNRSEINYEYDRDGLLTKAGDLNITRSPVHGQIVKSDLGFVTTGRGYTENGELHYEQYNAGRKLYMYVLGEKDSVGRITFRRDTVEKETWEGKKLVTKEYMYEYNSRGYLQKIYDAETGTSIFTASYDLNGNRTYVYNPHHKYNGGYPLYDSQDRLVSYGDYRYEYTEHGALSKKRDVNETAFDQADDLITTYSYDHGGNLLKVNLPNNDEISYTSDALNRRIAKMKNGNYEYKLLYSGQLSPIARLNDEDGVVEEYVYGSRVNVPEYMIKDGRKYRFITDHRGSVRMVVDTHDGTVMQRTDYDEFGLIIDEDLAENWTPVLFGYAGGLQDRDTGLIRFGARDYDPMVGRWTSKEPLGFNGSSNFYVYAENDPVNYYDFTGLDTYAVGGVFDFGIGTLLMGLSFHFVWDDDYNFGVRFTEKMGGTGTPLTATLALEAEQTNANNVKSLNGWSLCAGGSAGSIFGGGADYILGLEKEKYKGGAAHIGLTLKTPFPFELHGAAEHSTVFSINLKNDVYLPIKNTITSVFDYFLD